MVIVSEMDFSENMFLPPNKQKGKRKEKYDNVNPLLSNKYFVRFHKLFPFPGTPFPRTSYSTSRTLHVRPGFESAEEVKQISNNTLCASGRFVYLGPSCGGLAFVGLS